jgi:NADPH:quinone reductase-like Zn-dependent oxidoreductase
MKSIIVKTVNGEWEVGDVAVPEPADNQILVKSVYAAINPVY